MYITDEEIRKELQWRKYEEACRKDAEKWSRIEKNAEKFFCVSLAGCLLSLKVLV